MVVYFFLLDKLGFTFWSIICLFCSTPVANKTPGAVGLMPSPPDHLVVACLIISVVFGTAFAITLPSVLSPLIPSLGFILY